MPWRQPNPLVAMRNLSKPEVMKIWPTEMQLELPRMVTNEKGLIHRIEFDGPQKIGEKKYFLTSKTQINGIIVINAKAIIYLID